MFKQVPGAANNNHNNDQTHGAIYPIPFGKVNNDTGYYYTQRYDGINGHVQVGAYLHMAVDAIVSLGVVIAGIIIYFTKWYWIDGAVSLIIVVVIIGGTWNLLKHSLRLEMDGVPVDIEIDKIKAELLKANGVV